MRERRWPGTADGGGGGEKDGGKSIRIMKKRGVRKRGERRNAGNK